MVLRVLLDFIQLSDSHLVIFTQRIIDHITGNAIYPTPPVTMVALATVNDTFRDSIVAASMGGIMATATKNTWRLDLEDKLRKTANYVQTNADNDMEKMLSSGFEPASTNRVSYPLPQPEVPTVKNGPSTQLVVSVNTIANARSYETRLKTEGGTEWQPSTFTTGARRITVSGLTPGERYTVQVRALGGATGFSPWSDPTTHMSL